MQVANVQKILIQNGVSMDAPDEVLRHTLMLADLSEEEIDTALVLLTAELAKPAPPEPAQPPSIPVDAVTTPVTPPVVPIETTPIEEVAPEPMPTAFTTEQSVPDPVVQSSEPVVVPEPQPTVEPAAPDTHLFLAKVNFQPNTTAKTKPSALQDNDVLEGRVSISSGNQTPIDAGVTIRKSGMHKLFRTQEALTSGEIQQLLGIHVEIEAVDDTVLQTSGRYLSSLQLIMIWFCSAAVALVGIMSYMYINDVGLFHKTAGIAELRKLKE